MPPVKNHGKLPRCQSRIAELDNDIQELAKDNNYISNGGCLNFQSKERLQTKSGLLIYKGGNPFFVPSWVVDT